MSFDLVKAVRELPLKSPAKAVLLVLALRANDQSTCWPSVATIARESGYDSRTVQRAVASLIGAGLIVRELRPSDDGDNASNVYRLRVPRADSHAGASLSHPAPNERHAEGPADRHASGDCGPPKDPGETIKIEDPEDRARDARSRYRAAYADGIVKAKGSPFSFPTHKQASFDLNGAIAEFAKVHDRALRGDELLTWIRSSAEAFARYVIDFDDAKYWSAFEPRGFAKWLNQGSPRRPREQRRVGGPMKQPMVGDAPWMRLPSERQGA